jgi:DNA-directed RNA polymerase subunit omega
VWGRFKLTALIQRRWLELLQGARPMVESEGLTEMEIVVKEIMEDKIELIPPPEEEEEHDAEV